MKNNTRKKGKFLLAVVLVVAVLVTGVGVKKASAKVNNCTIVGVSRMAGGSGTRLFTSVKFSGSRVTLKGRFKAKINGRKKTLTMLTLLVSSNCKYYEEWDTGLHKVSKKSMKKYLQKGSFIELDVVVRSGKVVEFINGA